MSESEGNTTFVWPDDPNFKSFPKLLPEDCVEYAIHILDSTLTTAVLRYQLLEIQRSAEKLQKRLLKDYIWYRDGFNLSLSEPFGRKADAQLELRQSDQKELTDRQRSIESLENEPESIPLHLRGRTSYGDSLADEWLIVYLLRELSKQYPSLWIRVWDTDGQFLLIEAANVLPKWVNPEVADNRVWLHGGRVEIIPLKSMSEKTVAGLGREISISRALSYLQNHQASPSDPSHSLFHDSSLDKEAFSRIRNYPQSIPLNLHTTTVTIPRILAYLIHRHPSWISAGTEAFYLRDPIALKPLQSKTDDARRKLFFPPKDFVDIPVTMQRVGFAQLRSQEYSTPRAWCTAKWPDPSPEVDSVTMQRRRDIGMRLTCGFEMLLGDPQMQSKQSVREIKMLLEDLDAGDETLPDDTEIGIWQTEKEEDSEQWLDVNYEDLERTLNGDTIEKPGLEDKDITGAMKVVDGEKTGFGDRAAEENLRRMVQKFEDFLKDEDGGGIDGVDDDGQDRDEMDHDDASDVDDSDEDSSNDEEQNDSDIDEPDLTDAQLEELMAEMKSMGLKPPSMPSDAEDDIRSALLTLSDFRAPDIAAIKRKAVSEAKDEIEPAAVTETGPDVRYSTKNQRLDKHQLADSPRAQTAVEGSSRRPLWADPDPPSDSDSDAGEDDVEEIPRQPPPSSLSANDRVQDIDSDDSSDDFDPFQASEAEQKEFQNMIEKELREAGALDDFDSHPLGEASGSKDLQDPRYNLAKYMLESYKSQGGAAGPVGNLMGLMGLSGLPRDEGSSYEDNGEPSRRTLQDAGDKAMEKGKGREQKKVK